MECIKNNYQDITVKELNLLFLELKYGSLSTYTYGTYQYKAKIVNEYMGNLKVRDLDSSVLDDFYSYLMYERKWDNVDEPSNQMINNVYSYLNALLSKAEVWGILKSKANNIKDNSTSKENIVMQMHNKLLENELKRVSSKMESILNIK